MGNWSIVVPEAGTNLVTNPSAETGTSGLAASGANATITRYQGEGRFGSYAVRVQVSPAALSQGVGICRSTYYVPVTAGLSYAVSAYMRDGGGSGACRLSIDWYTGGDVYLTSSGSSAYTPASTWQRMALIATAPATAARARFNILTTGGTVLDIYVDGVQCEEDDEITDYIDGDQPGCSWTGAKHGSTSTRSAQSRAGGRVVDIEDTYDVLVQSKTGYGMPPIQHNVTERALLPGALLQSLKAQPRVLTLTVVAAGATPAAIHSLRQSLIDLVKPDRVTPLQPVRLRYTGAGTEVEISGYYDSGLTGAVMEANSEIIPLRFICYDPYWHEIGDAAASMAINGLVLNANYAAQKVDGAWSNISSAFNGSVFAVAIGPDGCVYLGGGFTNVGDANGDYIVKYNPVTGAISSLGTGANDAVNTILFAPDGSLYACGMFTQMGGVANTAYIARWDGANWTPLGTGLNGGANGLALAPDGSLYVVGAFTQANGVACTRIAKWDGSTFSPLSTGLGNGPSSVVVANDGTVYAAGTFTSPYKLIAKFDGTNWSNVGTGLDSSTSIYCLAVAPNGTLYAGGELGNVNGVAYHRGIAQWDGSSWSNLGDGLNSYVWNIVIDDNGRVHAVGDFTGWNIQATLSHIPAPFYAIWNGSIWTNVDVDVSSIATRIRAVALRDSRAYIVYDAAGTINVSAKTTVNNAGTSEAYPRLIIKRSGGTSATVTWLKNETTGRTVWLNYALLDSETLTIDFTPGAKAIASDFFGNVIGRALLPGSDFASFSLLPGDNDISLFIADAGSPTLVASMIWTVKHWGLDGGAA